MPTRRYRKRGGTRRKHSTGSSSLSAFQKEIAVTFLEMLMMVKLFHWKTHSYATHKATDGLYDDLNEHIDKLKN
jgi:DNA-binding ferritin-like protein